MIECTFLLDDDYSQAEKTFHIHWKDLEVYIRDNPNITFVLYHFSQRYKKKELIEFFSKIDLKNIVPWIH
jgi:ribonuclease BN (tRNA processing enzyme)